MPHEYQPWSMPEWMEPYRQLISNTGGNPIEALMNDSETTFFSNAVRATLIHCVRSQVSLLVTLHANGLLPERS